MGCPPDPVEVDIWRSSERIAALEERYERLRGEYDLAVRLAVEAQVSVAIPPGQFPAIKFTHRTDVVPTEWEQYADATAQGMLESGYRKRVKDLETALCELRTELIRKAGAEPALSRNAQFDRLREQHAQHREEDRAQAIQWLEERLQLVGFCLSEYAASRPQAYGKACASLQARAQARIAYLKSLKIGALLADRKTTAFDEREFDLPE